MNKVIQEAINALNDEGYPHLAERLEGMYKEIKGIVEESYTDEDGVHTCISLGTDFKPGDRVRLIIMKDGR